MNLNKSGNLAKVIEAFGKLEKIPKAILKYGLLFSFLLFTAGTLLMFINTSVSSFDTGIDVMSKALIKAAVSVSSQVIFGSILIDYFAKR